VTFLALTGWQVLLLCAATSLLVIWLFFLKLRYPRVSVASLLLWRRVLEDTQHRSLLERLRRLLSLLLTLTIALLIVLAFSQPNSDTLTGEPRNVVLILDTALSMAGATADGKTRWLHARARAQQIIESAGATDKFLLADTSGRISTRMTADREELLAALETMLPTAAAMALPAVNPKVTWETIFISDGANWDSLPAGVRLLSVFEPANNIAITGFNVDSSGPGSNVRTAHVEITSYSSQSADVMLTLSNESTPIIRRALTIDVGKTLLATVNLSSEVSGGIRAQIESAGDALALDDVAVDYVPPQREVQVTLVTSGNDYLETLLSLEPRVELRIIQPEMYRDESAVDIYVFDRFAPNTAPSRPALLFKPPGRAWLAGSDRNQALRAVVSRVTAWDESHPILKFVSFIDVDIRSARHLDFATEANIQIVAEAAQTPLIVTGEGLPHWVMVNFDFEESDFSVRPGFPIFMKNVIAWFVGESLTLRRRVGMVEVPLQQASIKSFDGESVAAKTNLGSTWFECLEPGLFVASSGDASIHVAVNLSSHGISDLNRSMLAEQNSDATLNRRLLHRELWVYLLLISIVLITLEWWTYHRRITV
tara:strand:- start:2669 stop:4459 length:1791 start_codon:yes stop_codon:yes gene_type:complete